MQVFTATTGGAWLAQQATVPPVNGAEPKPDPAELEARRVLSDVFRCNNLVVLAGLGTSLCVVDPSETSKRLAPMMSDLWFRAKAAHASDGKLSWDDLLKLVRHPDSDVNLESLLSRCRLAESFMTGADLKNVQDFISLAEQDISAAVNFLKDGIALPVHTEFLRRIARRSNRKARTKVFTTNYDRCFEEAARQGRYVVLDGFSPTVPPTFDAVHFSYDIVRRDREHDLDEFIPNLFHLHKLHGSIDWERHDTSGEIRKVPGTKNPLLIYPRYSKYELAFQQPYLEMMAALQGVLREQNTGLLVIGFGFNDDHVAEPILSAIRSNLGLKVAIVGPCLAPGADKDGLDLEGEASANGHLRKVSTLIASGDARLGFIAATFEELVPLVPDIAAETDLEKHYERLRQLKV